MREIRDTDFDLQPEPESGIFPVQRLAQLAERARLVLGAEVAAVLDLRGEDAQLEVRGALLDCTGEKRELLGEFLREVVGLGATPTPPRLLSVFGSLEVLVVPIRVPAGRLGVLAVSGAEFLSHPLEALDRIATDVAFDLEAEAELLHSALTEIPTIPAPPLDLMEEEAAVA